MARERNEIKLTADDVLDPAKKIRITHKQATGIVMGLTERVLGSALSTSVMESTLAEGSFFRVGKDGVIEETTERTALESLLADIKRLRAWDEPPAAGQQSFDVALLTEIGRLDGQPRCVTAHHLAIAFIYYDAFENVFNGHVHLARYLMRMDKELRAFTRAPSTPLGPDMEQGIRAEQVSPSEVTRLISGDIHPFRARFPHDTGTAVKDRLVADTVEWFRSQLKGGSQSLDLEDTAKKIVESAMKGKIAAPEEGIEDIPHPRRRQAGTSQAEDNEDVGDVG